MKINKTIIVTLCSLGLAAGAAVAGVLDTPGVTRAALASATNGAIATATNLAAIQVSNIFASVVASNGASSSPSAEDNRPSHVAKVELATMSAGGTIELLNVGAGTNGTVTLIQEALSPTGGTLAQQNAVTQVSTLNFQFGDGRLVSSYNRNFWRLTGQPTNYYSDACSLVTSKWDVDQQWASIRTVEIPFTNGLRIVVSNGSPSAASYVWSQVIWKEGLDPRWNTPGFTRKKWSAVSIPPVWVSATDPNFGDYDVTMNAYAQTNLVTVTNTTGELSSLMMYFGNGVNLYYLEGNMVLNHDGNSDQWGGTEDFFGGNFYWQNMAATYVNNRFGARVGYPAGLSAAWSDSALCWRNFYPLDRITFTNNLSIYWHNGQTNQSLSSPGQTVINSYVEYYTTQ